MPDDTSATRPQFTRNDCRAMPIKRLYGVLTGELDDLVAQGWPKDRADLRGCQTLLSLAQDHWLQERRPHEKDCLMLLRHALKRLDLRGEFNLWNGVHARLDTLDAIGLLDYYRRLPQMYADMGQCQGLVPLYIRLTQAHQAYMSYDYEDEENHLIAALALIVETRLDHSTNAHGLLLEIDVLLQWRGYDPRDLC